MILELEYADGNGAVYQVIAAGYNAEDKMIVYMMDDNTPHLNSYHIALDERNVVEATIREPGTFSRVIYRSVEEEDTLEEGDTLVMPMPTAVIKKGSTTKKKPTSKKED